MDAKPATRYYVLFETLEGLTVSEPFTSWQDARRHAASMPTETEVVATLGNQPLGGVHTRFIHELQQWADLAARVQADENESEDARLLAETLLTLHHNVQASSRMAMPPVRLKSALGVAEVTQD